MKKTVLFGILCLFSLGLTAKSAKGFLIGATTSADFGRFQDRIEFTPNVAVRILSKTYLGLGTTIAYYSIENELYQYSNINSTQPDIKDKIWYGGGELFLRFVPLEDKKSFARNLFMQTSFEALWGKGRYFIQQAKYKYNTANQTFFAGVGYKQPVSDKLSLGMLVNFKLNNEKDSPYRNPIIRFSLEF